MTDSEQVLQVTVRGAELGIDAIQKLLSAIYNALKNKEKAPTKQKLKHGKQSMKNLTKHREELVSIEVDKPELKTLQKELNRHGVDFHFMNDGKDKYQLFFMAKDSAQLEHAIKRVLENYTEKEAGKQAEKEGSKEKESQQQSQDSRKGPQQKEDPIQHGQENAKAKTRGKTLKERLADCQKKAAAHNKTAPGRGRAKAPTRGKGPGR